MVSSVAQRAPSPRSVDRDVAARRPTPGTARRAGCGVAVDRRSRAARTAGAASSSPPRHGSDRRAAPRAGAPSSASSGRASQRPGQRRAEHLRDSATLRNDEATYGRSLTYWSSASPSPAAAAADQPDRVDLEQQRGRAALRRSPPGRRRAPCRTAASNACDAVRVLVQQEAEVGRGRVGGGDGQQHRGRKRRPSGSPSPRSVAG